MFIGQRTLGQGNKDWDIVNVNEINLDISQPYQCFLFG